MKVFHLKLKMLNKFKEKYTFGEWKYKYYLLLRVKFLLHLLKINISFVLFETDSLWLKNPNQLLANYKNYDVIGAQMGDRLEQRNYSVNYMFVNSTKEGVEIWDEMTKRLANNLHNKYEQDIMDILCKQGLSSAKCTLFPYRFVSDGIWYNMNEGARNKLVPDPYIINNNYVFGIPNKISRAKKFGHWFLDDSLTCNKTHVRHVIKITGQSS